MIVGVEPLGHLHGRRGIGAAGAGEVEVERVSVTQICEAFGDGAQRDGCVEHMIVEREIVGWDNFDPGLFLEMPMARPQFARSGQKVGFG